MKTAEKNKNRTRKIKAALIVIMLVIALAGMTGCAKSIHEKTLAAYFDSLSALDFTKAGELLGDPEAYAEMSSALSDPQSYLTYSTDYNYFKFIYSAVRYEIVSESADETELCIYAYDTAEVLDYVKQKTLSFTSQEAYLSASNGERYIMLCDFQPLIYNGAETALELKQSTVTVKVIKNDAGNYVIEAGKDFFDALGGK